MNDASELRSGKGHRDENFPVASWLIRAAPSRADPGVLRFRAHSPTTSPITRHCRPRRSSRCSIAWRPGLPATTTATPVAVRCAARSPSATCRRKHAQDLLTAFQLDVTKLRYRDWDDLIDYCRYSAMPVGRFVSTCTARAAHLARQRRAVRGAADHQSPAGLREGLSQSRPRLYPARCARRRGASVEALGAPRASPRCCDCLHGLAERTGACCARATSLPTRSTTGASALEVSVINTLAHRLTRILMQRDPLSEHVHLGTPAVAGLSLLGVTRAARRAASAGDLSAVSQKPRGA